MSAHIPTPELSTGSEQNPNKNLESQRSRLQKVQSRFHVIREGLGKRLEALKVLAPELVQDEIIEFNGQEQRLKILDTTVNKLREKVTPIVEKVNPASSWEKVRKPVLLHQFREAGFENPEQAVQVVHHLEQNAYDITNDGYKDREPINEKKHYYHYEKKDVEMIRKLTDGVEDPMQLLVRFSNVVKLEKMKLNDFTEYFAHHKSNPRLLDLLDRLPQLGPLKKVDLRVVSQPTNSRFRYFGINSRYYNGEDPIERILSLPDEEYTQLFSSERLTFVRAVNSYVINANKNDKNINLYRSDISLATVPELLEIGEHKERSELFFSDLRNCRYLSEQNIHERASRFVDIIQTAPELFELQHLGFFIRDYTDSHSRRDVQEDREKFQEILANPVYTANARLLTEYGLPLVVSERKSYYPRPVHNFYDDFYLFPDTEVLERALVICKNIYKKRHTEQPYLASRDLAEMLHELSQKKARIGDMPEGKTFRDYFDDTNTATPLYFEQMIGRVRSNGEVVDTFLIDNYLNDQAFEGMSTEDQEFWRFYHDYTKGEYGRHYAHLTGMVLDNKATFSLLCKDGKPTEFLLRDALTIEERNGVVRLKYGIGPVVNLIGEDVELNENIHDPALRKRLTAINFVPAGIKEYCATFPDVIDLLYKDGQATPLLVKTIVEGKKYGALAEVLTKENVRDYDVTTQQFLLFWKDLPFDLKEEMLTKVPAFPVISEEQFAEYRKRFEVITLVVNTPSREIKRLEKELIDELWKLDDPTEEFKKIEDIFVRNNLPLVGKVFNIFNVLYANPIGTQPPRLDYLIDAKPNVSPVLKAASPKRRRSIIYHDLLKAHVESGNPSLRKFITILQEGQKVLSSIEEHGSTEHLSDGQRTQVTMFLNKMDTLYAASLLGKPQQEISSQRVTSGESITTRISTLKQNLRVREGQTVTGRIAEMFVKPLGYSRLEEVVQQMELAKTTADDRNRAFAREVLTRAEEPIPVNPGDLFKGVKSEFLKNILENGSVAAEFLGEDSVQDQGTPFDTDLGIVLEEDVVRGFTSAYINSPASDSRYGDIKLLVRNRGQFNSPNGYELFKAEVVGPRHVAVRTGFGATEIDGIIITDIDDDKLERIRFTVVKNGFYIPIIDKLGKIIFTPEQYDEYRKTFDGVAEYKGGKLSVIPVIETKDVAPAVIVQTNQQIQALASEIKNGERETREIQDRVRKLVEDVLAANNINLRGPYDTSLYGAEFFNTGSTGRSTNIPGDIDFDMSLLLDARDVAKMEAIKEEIKAQLIPTEDKSHTEARRSYIQLRAIGAHVPNTSNAVDIDIGIGSRTDYDIFASHDAVEAKLNSIRSEYGDGIYYDVLANIVLAKKILKEGHAYNRVEDGGFGGIGTENWILANNGNILQACKTFYAAAHVEGNVVSFDEFTKRYKVFNAGTNIKYPDKVENYIANMKPKGYHAMLQTITEYLQAA